MKHRPFQGLGGELVWEFMSCGARECGSGLVPGKDTFVLKPTDIAAPDYFHKVVDCQWRKQWAAG